MEIVVMVGVAGSGKSTYVRKMLPYHTYVSMDNLIKDPMWKGKRHDLINRYENEQPLGNDHPNSRNKKAECVLVDDALREGKDVVVDDTNLTKEIRRPYVLLARKHGADIRAVFFWNTWTARIRNKRREREERIPDDAITGQIAEMVRPTKEEGFGSIDKA